MKDTPKLHADYFLTSMARQLAANYQRLDKRFIGGRLFFTIADDDHIETRTLVMDANRPRLFSGYSTGNESSPFLHLKLTLTQLASFFAGTLDPHSKDGTGVAFEGNDQGFYEAIGRCL